MSWLGLAAALTFRAIRTPSLAVALLRVTWRFRSHGWYGRFPFLPLPDRAYLAWRMYTAYGDADAVPSARDVEQYARWATQ